MAETEIPLIADAHANRIFAWRSGQPVTTSEALADIQAVAERLPANKAFFNFCDDRYLFTVAFAAGALCGACNLLPQSRGTGILEMIRAEYPEAPAIDDAQVSDWLTEKPAPHFAGATPKIAFDQPIALMYTSGSTGQPTAHEKSWGELMTGGGLLHERLLQAASPLNVMASVPPQHMYGLETSVLPTLYADIAAESGRPLMPWAIAKALAQLPAPRVLVITPIQLDACVRAQVALPPLVRIISATAPLSVTLAESAEQLWHTEVHEIYGSSETGSIATRRTTVGDDWRLHRGITLISSNNSLSAQGGHLPRAMPLGDALELRGTEHFRLLGRTADFIKVAGKRASLAELTAELLALDGVQDAVVFVPPEANQSRPAALVVAPSRSPRAIAAALRQRVDPVFVPRPLLRVTRLPRTTLGKLPQADLLTTWRNTRQPKPADE